MPPLPAVREHPYVYGFSVVNDRGRVAVGPVLQPLGWAPDTRVAVGERRGLVVVTADPHGAGMVLPHGHLRVPAPVRRWCGLRAGSRVLLVADPVRRRLVLHPPASLDVMVGRFHAEVSSG